MNSFFDNAMVGFALLLSAGYAAFSLGPKSLKQRSLAALSRLAARAPSLLRLQRVAQKLAAASAVKASGACGGCDNCGSEASVQGPSSAAEINVPIAKIGRRV
jgi:hypothetical protein